MNDNKLWATIWICATVIVLVIILAVYKDCERTDNLRAQCIKDPKNSPADCRALFPDGDRR